MRFHGAFINFQMLISRPPTQGSKILIDSADLALINNEDESGAALFTPLAPADQTDRLFLIPIRRRVCALMPQRSHRRQWIVKRYSARRAVHVLMEVYMAKRKRRAWTNKDIAELKAHSKSRTPVSKISKVMKRTVGALRRKAGIVGIRLGHRR